MNAQVQRQAYARLQEHFSQPAIAQPVRDAKTAREEEDVTKRQGSDPNY